MNCIPPAPCMCMDTPPGMPPCVVTVCMDTPPGMPHCVVTMCMDTPPGHASLCCHCVHGHASWTCLPVLSLCAWTRLLDMPPCVVTMCMDMPPGHASLCCHYVHGHASWTCLPVLSLCAWTYLLDMPPCVVTMCMDTSLIPRPSSLPLPQKLVRGRPGKTYHLTNDLAPTHSNHANMTYQQLLHLHCIQSGLLAKATELSLAQGVSPSQLPGLPPRKQQCKLRWVWFSHCPRSIKLLLPPFYLT